jgi:hypothetical protein
MALTGCNTAGSYRRTDVYNRAVIAGSDIRIGPYSDLDPDCSLRAHPRIKVIEPPRQGTFTTQTRLAFSTYPSTNPRASCNARRTQGLDVVYRANPGASGADRVVFEVIWLDGTLDQGTLNLTIR